MAGKKYVLNAEEVAYFCYQLGTILDSGVPLYDGLMVMTAETRGKNTAAANDIMDNVINSLSMEKPLYIALEESGVFPDYCIKTVMAGELSGRLDEALDALTEYYENQARIHENIKNAVISPMIMLIIAAAVISVLTLKVLPMFASVFADFDPEIYASVTSSVSTAAILGTAMLIIFGVIFIAGAVFLSFYGRSGTEATALLDRTPFFRGTSEAIAIAKFTGAVSMMISSGLAPSEALSNVKNISSSRSVNNRIEKCSSLVMNETPFSDAVEQSGILPAFYAQTLRISYRSGSFDTAWKKISIKMNEEAERSLERMIGAVEPALTAVLTVAAGVIMLTVMLPLMNIMSSIV